MRRTGHPYNYALINANMHKLYASTANLLSPNRIRDGDRHSALFQFLRKDIQGTFFGRRLLEFDPGIPSIIAWSNY